MWTSNSVLRVDAHRLEQMTKIALQITWTMAANNREMVWLSSGDCKGRQTDTSTVYIDLLQQYPKGKECPTLDFKLLLDCCGFSNKR